MGTYRTAGIFPQRALLPHPEGLSDIEAAAYWVAAMTVVGGFAAGGLSGPSAPGKQILVTAASSGVGVMALQVARALGAEVIATTTSSAKAESLAELADHVIVVRAPADLASAATSLTGGSGVDLAFDPVGCAYADALLEAAAVDGRVVFYGTLTGPDAPLDLRKLIVKDLGVQGYTVYRLQRDPARLEAVVEACLELARTDKVRPLVAARYPFEEAPAALAALARNEHLGKIVLEVV
jgi:NADPH:quinone reductase-like Zn-dependent oxidoreductase